MASSSSFHLKFFPSSSAINPKSLLSTNGRIHSLARSSTNQSHFATLSLRLLSKTAIALIGSGLACAAPFFIPRPAWSNTIPVSASEEAEQIDEGETNTIVSFLNSNERAVESTKSLLQEKLIAGSDDEALKILENLAASQPFVIEWKLQRARLLAEMGHVSGAREAFEDILERDPLSFEAMFENAILMERCGEGEGAIKRLRDAIDETESRDSRIAKGEVAFILGNVDEALKMFDELIKEDGRDFRPYFCRGIIYGAIGRDEDAGEDLAKYRELSPTKMNGYVRSIIPCP